MTTVVVVELHLAAVALRTVVVVLEHTASLMTASFHAPLLVTLVVSSAVRSIKVPGAGVARDQNGTG